MSRPPSYDVAVIGGGVIGAAVAHHAAGAGLAVVVVDPEPGRGASWAAAGMLTPVTELHFGEEALLALNLAGAEAWPAFAAGLEAEVGRNVGYRRCGTLSVAVDEGDRAWTEQMYAFQRELGLESEWLTATKARAMEANLSPSVRGALWAPGDHQVHTRLLVDALLDATERRGVTFVADRAEGVATAAGAVSGVHLRGGGEVHAPAVVVAAGCWSGSLSGIAPGIVPPVRPVKGQILRLAGPPERPLLTRAVRGMVHGSYVYVVPRADGEVVVGATIEEQGYDTTVTAGAVYELLRDAHRVVPGVSELVLNEARAGLRPGSPDNGPVVGPSALDGLVLATGHYRNGVLLAPITATAVTAVLTGAEPPAAMAPFSPARFGAAAGTGRSAEVPC